MGHHDIEMQDKKMYCRGTLLRVPFKITSPVRYLRGALR